MNSPVKHSFRKISLIMVLAGFSFFLNAQSLDQWYANAQERIDTLRKGTFGLKILDKNGQPFTGKVSVRMAKHEFPFGIAFDLYEEAVNYGNVYTTTASIQADSDAEIYQSERWMSLLTYAIPVQKDKNYKLTFKLAEIYHSSPNMRLFDVYVEGKKFLTRYDIFAEAGGRNIAVDTAVYFTSKDTLVNIECITSVDNAAIKGMVIETTEGDWITRINCGGGALTTNDGNTYVSDQDFFDQHASRYPTEEQWMKAAMQKYFNYGVSGNSFKWSGIQPQHTAPNYQAFDNAVNWTRSIGWELRAHTLLWGGYNYEDDHATPRWVKDLPTAQAITDTCKMRVIREVTRYKGIVKEYDVMNEPLHATYLASRVGDSINWNCFKWARSADPDANLFINDYNVEYVWGDAKKYRDMILNMRSMGIPVTGVGMQAHFWEGMRPNVTEFVTQINIVAEAGLPIKFTEFDNGPLGQEDQAADIVKVLKIAFSHPAVNGIVNWALSDRGVWREGTGLFEANHKPKLAADSLMHYTHNIWTTRFDTVGSGSDPVLFNGYYGNYNVEVQFGDTIKVFTIPCIQANEDSIFVLSEADAALKGPVFLEARLLNDTSLYISFDKPVQNESISGGDFKFFSDNPVRIQSIETDNENDSIVEIMLQSPVTPNDYLAVSYFPGSLRSSDGGKAVAFGPETLENLTTGLISAEVTNDGQNIEARFNARLLNLVENLSSFAVTVDGQPAVISGLDYKENDSTLAVFTLASPILKGSKPTLQYTKGTLMPANGFACGNSPVMAVSNNWPALVKAEVNTTGTKITAVFGTLLQNVLSNQEAFTISVDGQPVEIISLTETGTDSAKITFSLNEPISKGQIVTLSYQPGTIKGINGNSLTVIDNFNITNRSGFTAIDSPQNGSLLIYPNPASGYIYITGPSVHGAVTILNSQGVVVYRNPENTEAITVDISAYQKGVYLIQVVDLNGHISTSKVVIE
ncbi:MAG: endo-1,4-beta-xylanase [Bacteroidales bacterium]|nr:endo-1,4-beta-xylanase [Bacteroidales bacterium]MBN2761960.1 endo-1,4-beta-xylanase [Bacteroidales bacterium]